MTLCRNQGQGGMRNKTKQKTGERGHGFPFDPGEFERNSELRTRRVAFLL